MAKVTEDSPIKHEGHPHAESTLSKMERIDRQCSWVAEAAAAWSEAAMLGKSHHNNLAAGAAGIFVSDISGQNHPASLRDCLTGRFDK